MASGSGRKSGGDRVVESRHLVGLFLGVVLLCGVFFTLGYVMGHTQYGSSTIHASSSPAKETETPPAASSKKQAPAPAADSPEWDFYPSKKSEENLEKPAAVPAKVSQPATATPAAVKTSATTTKPATRYQPPRIPRGSLVLQVAALKSEGDALALTDALQKKRFPAFVVTPVGDNLYRVQVGPYADPQSAAQAKQSLEREGFRSILKR